MDSKKPRRRRLLPAAALAFVLAFVLSHRGESPPRTRAVSDAGGRLREIVVHFMPQAAPLLAAPYGDLFRSLPPAVTVHVAVPDQEAFAAFSELMAEKGAAAGDRFRPLVMNAPITPWAKDRFLSLAFEADGRPLLLVPPRPESGLLVRANDWWVPWQLARGGSGARVRAAPLDFDGGDFAADAETVFADTNLVGKNVPRFFPDRRALRRFLEARCGRSVLILGDEPGDVPDHHIGMYLAPLGNRTIAIGDIDLALELLRRAGRENLLEELGADLSPARRARFAKPARQLRERGYRLVPLPLLPLSEERVFVTYTNLLLDERDGERTIYLPVYREPVLDDAATAAFAREGFRVVPVDVSPVYRQRGTLRCLVGVIQRD